MFISHFFFAIEHYYWKKKYCVDGQFTFGHWCLLSCCFTDWFLGYFGAVCQKPIYYAQACTYLITKSLLHLITIRIWFLTYLLLKFSAAPTLKKHPKGSLNLHFFSHPTALKQQKLIMPNYLSPGCGSRFPAQPAVVCLCALWLTHFSAAHLPLPAPASH